MRLFIGISLDQHVKFELQHLQEVWLSHAYTFNKTRFDNFHLTLKFLGEIDPSQIDLIMESLEHALMKTQSFEIKIHGIGSFNRNNESILWTDIADGKKELQSLASNIEKVMSTLQICEKSERFVPHITLARKVIFKENQELMLPLISIKQEIKTVTLFHSHQVNGVLTYTPIDYISLK